MAIKEEKKKKYIISASRREDMLTFSPDRLETILKGNALGPLKHINSENIHTLVIWTRDFRNALRGSLYKTLLRLTRDFPCQIIFHFTVTGLAGTILEPGVPLLDELTPELGRLIDLIDGPERIFWRYDPLIRVSSTQLNSSSNMSVIKNYDYEITNMDKKIFAETLKIFSDFGIKKCVTSIVSPYNKVLKRLKKAGLSLIVDKKNDEEFIFFMKDLLESKKMTLQTCCTSLNALNGACICHAELEKLHPLSFKIESNTSKPRQRENCLCDKSWDVGWYKHCPHECIYCYARP